MKDLHWLDIQPFGTLEYVVLSYMYLRGLGANETLSLHLLTLKSVVLLALTRPARSVDLSKLDIRARSFTAAGVTFKALYLSKQRRASSFIQHFPKEEVICPVTTF